MKQKKLVSIVVFALILILPQYIHSKSNYKYVHSPDTDVYFGHVSYVEVKHDGKDPVVIREGKEEPDVAVLNFPLLPGDTIRTTESRRCEIQLDTGTIIRLGLDTELKIETILAECLTSRNGMTNFLLNKGKVYIMYKRYSYREIFQVVTPNAAVKMKHGAVTMINAGEDGSTGVQVKRGKVHVAYGPDMENLDKIIIKKSDMLTISKDHKALLGEYTQDVDFELWNEWINENYEELHEGLTPLPKPIRRYPKAVVYFAQRYSNIYGEWVWDDYFGYVWRPNYNDYYPWGTWSPYIYGHWREVNGQLFWVPEESWGWVPYHLGLWMWSKKQGWIWIPGSAFAPSWTVWDYYMDYYYWRPWALWDWYYYNYGYYYGGGFYPYYYGYYPYYYWDLNSPYYSGENTKKILRTIRKSQLRKPKTPTLTMPKEFRTIYMNVVSALIRGDRNILGSLRKIPEHMVTVRKEDLNAKRIHEKAVRLPEISFQQKKESLSSKSLKSPYREAVGTVRKNNAKATWRIKTNTDISGQKRKEGAIQKRGGYLEAIKKTISTKDIAARQISSYLKGESRVFPKKEVLKSLDPYRFEMRVRDWNPDSKLAHRLGVSINYSSRSNEVRCPELRISSRDMHSVKSTVTRSRYFSSGGRSSYSGSGVSSSSSSSSSSSRGSRSSASRGSSSSSSRSGGSKGGTRKH